MPSQDWFSQQESPEDMANVLHQRTEELYRIENAEADADGVFECNAILLRDIVVFPHMISPIFIIPGANLFAIQDAQYNYNTVVAMVQSDPEEEDPIPEDYLHVGVEVAVGVC